MAGELHPNAPIGSPEYIAAKTAYYYEIYPDKAYVNTLVQRDIAQEGGEAQRAAQQQAALASGDYYGYQARAGEQAAQDAGVSSHVSEGVVLLPEGTVDNRVYKGSIAPAALGQGEGVRLEPEGTTEYNGYPQPKPMTEQEREAANQQKLSEATGLPLATIQANWASYKAQGVGNFYSEVAPAKAKTVTGTTETVSSNIPISTPGSWYFSQQGYTPVASLSTGGVLYQKEIAPERIIVPRESTISDAVNYAVQASGIQSFPSAPLIAPQPKLTPVGQATKEIIENIGSIEKGLGVTRLTEYTTTNPYLKPFEGVTRTFYQYTVGLPFSGAKTLVYGGGALASLPYRAQESQAAFSRGQSVQYMVSEGERFVGIAGEQLTHPETYINAAFLTFGAMGAKYPSIEKPSISFGELAEKNVPITESKFVQATIRPELTESGKSIVDIQIAEGGKLVPKGSYAYDVGTGELQKFIGNTPTGETVKGIVQPAETLKGYVPIGKEGASVFTTYPEFQTLVEQKGFSALRNSYSPIEDIKMQTIGGAIRSPSFSYAESELSLTRSVSEGSKSVGLVYDISQTGTRSFFTVEQKTALGSRITGTKYYVNLEQGGKTPSEITGKPTEVIGGSGEVQFRMMESSGVQPVELKQQRALTSAITSTLEAEKVIPTSTPAVQMAASGGSQRISYDTSGYVVYRFGDADVAYRQGKPIKQTLIFGLSNRGADNYGLGTDAELGKYKMITKGQTWSGTSESLLTSFKSQEVTSEKIQPIQTQLTTPSEIVGQAHRITPSSSTFPQPQTVTDITLQTPTQKITPIEEQTPITKQTTTIPPSLPIRTQLPPPPTTGFPHHGIGAFSFGGNYKTPAPKAKYGYSPSFTALLLNIRGKKPKAVGGIELRPIPSSAKGNAQSARSYSQAAARASAPPSQGNKGILGFLANAGRSAVRYKPTASKFKLPKPKAGSGFKMPKMKGMKFKFKKVK